MNNISFSSGYGRYSINRLSLPNPYASLRETEKRFATSEKNGFIRNNSQLINFIGNINKLNDQLENEKIKNSADLKDIVLESALKNLSEKSPFSKEYLSDNFSFAQFISQNIGKIADILNKDQALSQAIIKDGNVVGGPIIEDVIKKTVNFLGPQSALTEEFFRANPEAAVHLMENPNELNQVKNYSAKAQSFLENIGKNISSYETEIANKAKELTGRPEQFSLDFLQKNKDFSLLVVASEHDGESLTLGQFIQSHPKLTQSGEFSVSGLVKSYQVELAAGRFSGSSSGLSAEFFQDNGPLALAVILSSELANNLKGESSLNSILGSESTTSPLSAGLKDLIDRVYQSSFKSDLSSPLQISIFA